MILIKFAFISLFLFAPKQEDFVQTYVKDYIEAYKFIAIDEMVRTGIPASVIMAQAIIESNAGVSRLARMTNNHFGIKCKDYWAGEEYYFPDDDRDSKGNLIPSCFRMYDTVTDSYFDHSEFLRHTHKYQYLFNYDKTDYEQWSEGLEICGYASDEKYAEKLIRTIELYQLHELDYYTIQYVEPSELESAQSGK